MGKCHLGLNEARPLWLLDYECHYAFCGAGYAKHSDVYAQYRHAVEHTKPISYSPAMTPKALIQQNPYLRNAQHYQRALRANVLSSTGIEGVKKAAERALAAAPGKLPAKQR